MERAVLSMGIGSGVAVGGVGLFGGGPRLWAGGFWEQNVVYGWCWGSDTGV